MEHDFQVLGVSPHLLLEEEAARPEPGLGGSAAANDSSASGSVCRTNVGKFLLPP